MNKKLRSIFTNWRVIILILATILAVVALAPDPWNEGVAIRSVEKSSPAALAGMLSPAQNVQPMQREKIIFINNQEIKDMNDYSSAISSIEANRTVQVRTSKGAYRLTSTVKGDGLGLNVQDAPKTNIRLGLDLQGGTRVLLKPEEKLSDENMATLIDNMKQRLNVYGLSDIVVREASDLSGSQYILVEIAGVSEDEVKDLLAKQGKFEAKIANETVFIGGQDITYVCRSAQCSGIDPNLGCQQASDGSWFCRFQFSISLTPDAADRQANLTKNLDIVPSTTGGESYLSENLQLFLDDKNVDNLSIGSDLKGRPVTDIAVSGSGVGVSETDAVNNALLEMKRLQTIMITGSLPVKLEITKTDSISPALGAQFLQNAMFIGLLAILGVIAVLLISYRRIQIAVPILLTCLLEVFLLLGVAGLIGWGIDLAAIAGIIIALGTGIDDQIVITDEVLRGETRKVYSWKDKMKSAFFIIFGAYFTIMVSMLPLLFAGAGLLKGLALTQMIGITIGVFITRPAYASIIEILLKD